MGFQPAPVTSDPCEETPAGTQETPAAICHPAFCLLSRLTLNLPLPAPASPALYPPCQTSEVDNLRGVVRELTESRSKAVSQRAVLAEKYAELQQEYHRMLRIADLSRTVRCGAAQCSRRAGARGRLGPGVRGGG